MTGGGESVCIDEPTDLGIVITALEIIQAGIVIVALAIGAKICRFGLLSPSRKQRFLLSNYTINRSKVQHNPSQLGTHFTLKKALEAEDSRAFAYI